MNPTIERALWASTPALRCLAALDAMLVPALGLYWIKTLPASGGLVGAVLGVFCLWIGARRAYRALFDCDLDEVLVADIRKATSGGYVVGSLRKSRGRQMRKMGSVPNFPTCRFPPTPSSS